MAAKSMTLSRPLELSDAVKILFRSLVIILLIVIGLWGLAWLKWPSPTAEPSQASTSKAAVQEQTETVKSTLKSSGFTPASVSCRAGEVLLVIDDESGTAGLTFRLTRANGDIIADYELPRGVYQLRQQISLQPGKYAMKELNHPDWVLWINAR